MADFKKDVPVDRTVVPGIWSDLLDCWSHSFQVSGTPQNVIITDTMFLNGLKEQFQTLHNDNEQLMKLLRAVLMGIEIIADQENGSLLDNVEEA